MQKDKKQPTSIQQKEVNRIARLFLIEKRAKLRNKQKGLIISELAVGLACVMPFLYLGAILLRQAGAI